MDLRVHAASFGIAVAIVALLLAGCSPISDKATIALFEAMKERSSCILIGGGAGAGAITVPLPTIPLSGGYGYLWVGRAMPGHSVTVNGEGCRIEAIEGKSNP